jgi:hypothetical protein
MYGGRQGLNDGIQVDIVEARYIEKIVGWLEVEVKKLTRMFLSMFFS